MNDICLLTVQVHVIGTLLSQVLPALFPPCYVFREVGPVIVSGQIREELLRVSSDGVIECINGNDCCYSDEKLQ